MTKQQYDTYQYFDFDIVEYQKVLHSRVNEKIDAIRESDASGIEKEEEIRKLTVRRKDENRSLLKKHGFHLHLVDGLYIPLNPSWERIAVNLSGGADSAVLTSILANIIQENNYNITIDLITHNRGWRARPWQMPISKIVYNKLKDIWGDTIGVQNTNFIPPELEHGAIGYIIHEPKQRSGDQVIVEKYNEYIAYENNYQAIFTAITKNADLDIAPEDRMQNRDVDIQKADIHDLAICKTHFWELHPFKYIEKDWVIKQYKNMDLLDLLKLTRSCEGDGSNMQGPLAGKDAFWYNKDKNVEECGLCYWCKEKAWALEENGIEL